MTSFISENTLLAILKTKHHCEFSSIRVLDWHTDENILEAGSNYTTRVSRLTIRYRLEIGTHEDDISPLEEHFFVKVPGNAPLYELAKGWGCYVNEVTMYTEVLPQMRRIVDNQDEFFVPRHYYSDDDLSLVLEDLSQSGYKCADRIQQLDIEHCFYALRSLAKFHALSVKLETTIGLAECVKREPIFRPEGVSEVNMAFIKSQVPVFIDSLPQNLKDRYPNMVTYFENFSCVEVLNDITDRLTSTKFNVLCHGDFWTNNIMFKYDKYGTVEDVKLIDFQYTMWSSPVRDLIHFTINSVKFDVYVKYFPLMLRIYLDTLNRVLIQLNCPKNYHMDSLLEDLDTMYPIALYVLGCVLPIGQPDPDDPIDSMEPNGDVETKSVMNSTTKTDKQKQFLDILANWFEHFAKKGTNMK
ncbi:uncharacterized protein LOC135846813 [Planococcus citri]|uniref:uncharacterized protein LOC135846813 n=1 Tax=Planococcus citri TaxID=170843 RepID=UPI0031F9B314